jgi:hypothetical protein
MTFSHQTPRRRGILWDTFDVYPDVPEGTFFSKTCRVASDWGETTGGETHGLVNHEFGAKWESIGILENCCWFQISSKFVAGFKYL